MSSQAKKIFFVIVLLIWSAISWGYCLFFDFSSISNYFVSGSDFSDFYTPMIKEISNTYEPPFFSNYPPLANLFFVILRMITNVSVENGEIIPNTQVYICFAVFVLLSEILIFALVTHELNKIDKNIWNYIIALLLLTSGPFLFLYQRGNILLLIIGLVGIFLFNYDSDRVLYRTIALISLSIAIAVKIYPAVFIIVLIFEKQWKDALRTILYTGIFYIIPFGIYGFETIPLFINNLFFRDGKINNVLNHAIGFKGSFKILSAWFMQHINADADYYNLLLILGCASLIYIFITTQYKWMKLSALTLMMLWTFNGSYLYNTCFLIFPFVFFLKEPIKRKIDYIYMMLFCLFFSINFLPDSEGINRILNVHSLGKISWGLVIVQIGLLIFAVTMLLDNINNRKKEKSIDVA